MIIPPSFPAGAALAPGADVAATEVGALVGVRAVAGNAERQDEERASRDAGVVFEHSTMPPPLELYGPDGKRVGAAEGGDSDDEPEEGATIEASAEGEEVEGPRAERDLSAEDREVLADMKARDAEVRAHEAAHVAAGGSYVQGGASFSFETGPDGKQYAVGGEVGIDTSPVAGDPQATAAKARTVRAAALAPASPSGADRAIASQASQMEAQAMVEIATEQRERASGGDGTPWDRYVQDHAPEGSTPASSFSMVA